MPVLATDSKPSLTLDGSLQILIDTRLDTIDRILMGRVHRSDRLAIIREVESQIEELMAERDTSTLSREDILEILARLDPPEAYIPEECTIPTTQHSPKLSRKLPSPLATPAPKINRIGLLGGILGSTSFGLLFVLNLLVYVLAVALNSEFLLIAGSIVVGFLGFAGGLFGLILGIMGRNQGAMPIIGIASGIMAIMASIIVPIGFIFLL